jgi:intergrase/recombinase
MNMRLCRKVFASWLIQSGIDSTTVDMLQGRCPPNILARHYQSPYSSLCNRVLDAVNALMKEIDR